MKRKLLWGMLLLAFVFTGVILFWTIRNQKVVTVESEEKITEEQIIETETVEPTEESIPQTDSGYYGALKVDGSKLTDERGNPVLLRGVCIWYPQYANDEAISFMHRQWGINVIRLALYTTGDGGYCVSGEEQKQQMEETVDCGVRAAAVNDMYVIIDWNILADGNPNSYIGQAETFFSRMSEKYKDYDNVLYEICNEPNGGTSWSDVKTYAENVIPFIRANDDDAVVIVGTPDWCQGVDAAKADPIQDQKNIMYALHFYANSHREELRNKADQALQAGLPIFVSEFGLCDASGGGVNDIEEADLWMQWMNENEISCVQWNLSNKDETCSLIKNSCTKTTDWTDEELSESGIWMKNNVGGVVKNQIDIATEQEADTESETEETVKGEDAKSENVQIVPVKSWSTDMGLCTQYAVKITNLSEQTATSWTLAVTFNQDVNLQDNWCAKYSCLGDVLMITPEDYNSAVAMGGMIDNVGFIVESESELSVEKISLTWN